MSNSGLMPTVAFKLAGGPPFFGLEGSPGCAGQALDWLNVGLGMAREVVVDLQEEERRRMGVVEW
jgi:glycerol kinase